MQMSDVDWRAVMNSWSRADVAYLRSIYDEKINQMDAGVTKRKTIIRGQG